MPTSLRPLIFFSLLSFPLAPLLGAESDGAVHRSTATGDTIRYDAERGVAIIEGDAVVITSTATLKADTILVYPKEKRGVAEGDVTLIEKRSPPAAVDPPAVATGTVPAAPLEEPQPAEPEEPLFILKGDRAEYFWEASTGSITHARGASPPWTFSADRMTQIRKGVYEMHDGWLSSCNLDPPHYRIRAKRGVVHVHDRATLTNARLTIGDFPMFWTPIYSRSLIERKYTLRVEPGQSGRDGLKVRTLFGYPFTPNTETRFTWDYLQLTGNRFAVSHRYFRPDLQGQLDTSFLQDDNPDPQPERRRYDILWNHYQQLAPRLTMNAKLDWVSDQTFTNESGDRPDGIRVQSAERGILSEVGFSYQWSKAALLVEMDRRDRFDATISSESFISSLTLPRVTFNTVPMKLRFLPFYTRFTGSWANETGARVDPDETLRYQRSAAAGVELSRDLRVSRNTTVTPRLGFTESWRDRKTPSLLGSSESDVYQGRYNVGADFRHRIARPLDFRGGYDYVVRLTENSLGADTGADDYGVEANQFTAALVSRLGRNTRASLSSGYDLRTAPRSDLDRFEHESARIRPVSLDVHMRINRHVNVFFRETYDVFPIRTPLNTAGEIQIGELASPYFFSQGFSYTKPSEGAESAVNFTNRFKFYLTSKWYIDAFLSYQAVGPKRLNFRKIRPIEKSISVTRDLHCWVFRMTFSERTGRREARFHIDLKTNFRRQTELFQRNNVLPFYPFYMDPNAESDASRFLLDDPPVNGETE